MLNKLQEVMKISKNLVNPTLHEQPSMQTKQLKQEPPLVIKPEHRRAVHSQTKIMYPIQGSTPKLNLKSILRFKPDPTLNTISPLPEHTNIPGLHQKLQKHRRETQLKTNMSPIQGWKTKTMLNLRLILLLGTLNLNQARNM